MPKSDFKFRTEFRVRWMECDAQGIVFNGAYLGYLEVAQAEYFRNLGFSIYRIAQRGYFDSAVVKTTLEFKAPARVDDVLELHTRVARIGNTSLVLEMEIYRQDSDQPLSSIEAIYVGFHADTLQTRPVPDAIRTLVDHFEATGETLPLEGFPELHAAAR
jgi:acyl-CoA thioester hydrolase